MRLPVETWLGWGTKREGLTPGHCEGSSLSGEDAEMDFVPTVVVGRVLGNPKRANGTTP